MTSSRWRTKNRTKGVALIGAAAFRDGTGYATVYAIWVASWWPSYVVTWRCRDFKQTTAIDSYWRMF